ncbi:MAG: xanthine dehydrogenase family protein molybdopterin-binding subunit [Planctomycetota bacterium]
MSREETLKVGFPLDQKEITVKVPDSEPRPWDLSSQLNVVGKAYPRLDGVAKVTGRAKYSYDINLPGMLFGRIKICPHAHAKVLSVDATQARALPGVKAVITAEGKEVRYAGDDVAAVAATSEDIARDAVDLIQVQYQVLPFVVDEDQAIEAGAPQVLADVKGNIVRRQNQTGDPDKGLTESDAVHEDTYRTQVQTHCCLETHGTVCRWEGDKLTVWASTQGTFSVKNELAGALGVPAENVRVITEYMGGGFGSKFGAGAEGVLCARLAREASAPVKLMRTREQEHLGAGNRPSSVQYMKAGAKRSGELQAMIVDARGTGGIGGGAGVSNPMIYRVANTRKISADVFINAGPQAAFRAPGHPQGSFALEAMIDDLAEKIGMDPLEFRRKNDPNPVRNAEYAIGAEKIGWSQRQSPAGSQPGRMKTGIGMASARWFGSGGRGAEVIAQIDRDGRVSVSNGCQDIGTGTRTLMAIVAAEVLGLEPHDVLVNLGDTQWPVGPASGGSTTAPTLAPAVRTACESLKRKLFETIAPRIGVAADQLALAGGRVKGGGKDLALKEAAALLGTDKLSVQGDRADNYRAYQGEVAGCQFAAVEVDTDTGIVRVKKFVAVHDCGRVVNRLAAESQVNGAIIQGISWALFENRLMDPNRGYMVNPNLEMYKIAGPLDLPEMEVVFFEVANGGNNIGLMGLGEPPAVPVAAAIGNAVKNALGVRVKELPITPDRVLAALKGTRSKETKG